MEIESGVAIHWAEAATPPGRLACRACGAAGDKPVLLRVDAKLPHRDALHLRFLGCPACGCAFVEGSLTYDYDGLPTTELGLAIHVESGAGLWPIVHTLARLTLPPGARLLEIGCGAGFGLDVAIRARGWRATGIDPSTMAVAGRALLDVPIESRYFGDRPEDQEPAGCILASEVIEHIDDPRAFVAMLRGALSPEGVLVLTTPDRALLQPGAPDLQLVPLLSVGAHLVLFTAAGLEALLLGQGFGHVKVESRGAQLVAYASAVPLRLEGDEAALRAAYRAYLEGRAVEAVEGSLLWWGFAGRAYEEAVVDDDTQQADLFWAGLRAGCQAAFDFDPEHPASVPVPADGSLEALAACRPKALPTLLYARALDLLHRGGTLADVAPWMRQAASAAEALNTALLGLGAVDQAAHAARQAALGALAALAADGAAPDCLHALALAIEADPDAAQALARRSFVGLVNAGDHAGAAALRARWDLGEAVLDDWEAGRPMPAGARDALFCLAIVDLERPDGAAVAMRRFARARDATKAGVDVWWAALRGECIAGDRLGRHHDMTALLRAVPLDGMPKDLRVRLG